MYCTFVVSILKKFLAKLAFGALKYTLYYFNHYYFTLSGEVEGEEISTIKNQETILSLKPHEW